MSGDLTWNSDDRILTWSRESMKSPGDRIFVYNEDDGLRCVDTTVYIVFLSSGRWAWVNSWSYYDGPKSRGMVARVGGDVQTLLGRNPETEEPTASEKTFLKSMWRRGLLN